MKELELWEHQKTDVRALFAALKTHRRVCYVLPTGGGKTAVAVRVMQQTVRAGGRVLVLTHRKELIDQMASALARDGIAKGDIGRIRATDKMNLGAPVQVASVQTLARRTPPPADLAVADEAHRAAADTWAKILAWYPDARILGLTATPTRLDGKPLDEAFDALVHGPMFSELVAAGVLAAPRVYAPAGDGPNLDGVPTSGGDYHRGKLSARMRGAALVGDVPAHYAKHGRRGRAVVFAVDRLHARTLVAAFRERSVAVEYLDGDTPSAEREAMIGKKGRLERGVTRVVVNVDVLTEGWDCPAVKCIIIARPTKSLRLYVQMCGRGLRPYGERVRGVRVFVPPIILDHAGNCYRHGLPDVDRVYALERLASAGAGGEAPVKRCPECGRLQAIGNVVCVECAYAWPVVGRREADEGELVELTRKREEAMKSEWARLTSVVAKLGKDPSVARAAFVAAYGREPEARWASRSI